MPSIESDAQRNQKRHPTIGNHVIIGSGAQILGPINIGDYAHLELIQWFLKMCFQMLLL